MALPHRRWATICIKSFFTGGHHRRAWPSTALWESQRRVFPVPGGANPRMCGAVSEGAAGPCAYPVANPERGDRRPVGILGHASTLRPPEGCFVQNFGAVALLRSRAAKG